MESKKIVVTLNATIRQNGSKEYVKQQYDGDYKIINNRHVMRLKGEQQLTLKIDNDQLSCLFEQHATKKMVFTKQHETMMEYHLPQGVTTFKITTKQLDIIYKNEYVSAVKLKYVLMQDTQLIGKYEQVYYVTQQ